MRRTTSAVNAAARGGGAVAPTGWMDGRTASSPRANQRLPNRILGTAVRRLKVLAVLVMLAVLVLRCRGTAAQ
jgi:hypothetical protein